MRYWVYINGKVIEMPFEEGELSAIKGFNADTLVCKETPAAGETQEWLPAKMLIESYKQPAPPPPPSRQVIEKFAAKPQDTFLKEPKGTILSSNIFGSEEKKEPEHQPQQNNNEAAFGQTEAIFPEETAQEQNEQEKLKEELFSEPPTEVISFDKLEVFDVDKHAGEDNIESEEEILKTAIRTTISSRNTNKKENQTLQAIDIINNNNIDISDTDEEKPEEVKTKDASTEKATPEESLENIMPSDGEERVLDEVAQKQDFSQTELTPLGDSDKKPLTRLFDSEPAVEEQPAKEEIPQEQVAKQEEPVKEEIPQEQPVSEEEEFNPEEEISLEDDNFIIETNNVEKPIIENNTPAPKEVQEVIQELAEDNKVEIQEQQPFEETFKTSPALVAEDEKPKEEVEIKQENNILDVQPQENNIEEHPTTLDELTNRYPVEEVVAQQEEPVPQPQEEKNKQEENQPTGIVIPAEIHPDIIVEEIKEEGTEENNVEENLPAQKTQTIPEKDNFLNTFSSDIETVFLDQPTAFISDYIPPAETNEENNLQVMEAEQKEGKAEILDIKSDQGQHQVSLQNVRRVKPAAIKTVPMVEGEHQDPFSQTQIQHLHDAEVAMAKVERNSNFINLLKTFGLLFVLLVMVMAFVALIAQINIIPKGFSPFHALYTSMTGGEKKPVVEEKPITPTDLARKDLEEAEALRIKNLIQEVKDYQLSEGISLEEKIKLIHPNVYNQLTWEASQLPNDLTYYSVKVSFPTNPEGYAQVNYLFNYNTVTYTVEATNSEANNLMLTPYKKNVQQTQIANN